MRNHQRSLRNMFVQPRFQLTLSLYYIVVGGLILSLVGFLILGKLSEVQAMMNNAVRMDFQSQARVNQMMLECVQMSLAGFGVFIGLSFIFALVISHRIAGPQVAIKAFISELKKGNYDYKRNLRPRDELTEIMDALKELAPVLKEREAKG